MANSKLVVMEACNGKL